MSPHFTETSLQARAEARGFTDPKPIEGARGQCNTKVDALTYWHFKRACVVRGESYAQVLERMMQVYVAQIEGTHVLHMDGEECPLSRLITSLADETRKMVQP